MGSSRIFLYLALSIVCISVGQAHWPRRGGRGGHDKWWSGLQKKMFSQTCLAVNTTDDMTIVNKTCGCGDEEKAMDIQCSLSGITKTDEDGNIIDVTFCDVEPQWNTTKPYKGVLKYACNFENVGTADEFSGPDAPFKCPGSINCTLGPLTVNFNGTDVEASFCDFPVNMEMHRPDKWHRQCIDLDLCRRSKWGRIRDWFGRFWGRRPGRGRGRGRRG